MAVSVDGSMGSFAVIERWPVWCSRQWLIEGWPVMRRRDLSAAPFWKIRKIPPLLYDTQTSTTCS
jgi:hypothetical protein